MDKYERIRVVGRGAFGTVYLCRRLRDHREIPVEQLSRLDRLATINEVKVLAMLQHPNVIEYYDNFIQDQAMMIVMEYAAGGTLHDYLESKASSFSGEMDYLDEAEIAHLFAQIVLPLNLVHEEHILHRDLKTQNIFLTKSMNHVKIGDFGISKILSSKSKAMSIVGTPSYISPELCEGKPYNAKSDVWALGCVLYEMCTLKRAFEAPTLPALVLKIMRGNFQPLPVHYSPGLVEMVSSLLSLDPSARPSIPHVMAHYWLAPQLYKIPTSLGALPVHPKSASRSRHRKRQEEMEDEERRRRRRDGDERRSVSPFVKKQRCRCVVVRGFLGGGIGGGGSGGGGGESFRVIPLQPPPKGEVVQLSPVSQSRVFGVSDEGRVVEWTDLPGGNNPPRAIDGLSGITITHIAIGGSESDSSLFVCLVTDRGILLTYGGGKDGCLGHGDRESVEKPKIVESLLGEEVLTVVVASSVGDGSSAPSASVVAALTSENEVFIWGGEKGGAACAPRKVLLAPVPSAVSGGEAVISSIHCCISSPLVVMAAVLRDGKVVVGSVDLADDASAHLNFKHLPHRSPKKYSSFKGAIVLTVDEAAVLAESGEIGIVSLTDDEEATVKSLADNEKARQICCGRGLDGRILIALSDTGSVHVLDLDPAKSSQARKVSLLDISPTSSARVMQVEISADKTLAAIISP